MRRFRTSKARGFTLVELMIVVAIIGVLAALAIYGVRKYLSSAKSAEAKNSIGAISRAAVAAYERENLPSQLLQPGESSAVASHSLCGSATNEVPDQMNKVQGKKYQPNATEWATGNQTTGWACLKFTLEEPIRYQYSYNFGAGPKMTAGGGAYNGGANGFEAAAQGDLDGDGTEFSYFAQTGGVNDTTKQLIVSTALFEANAEE